MGEVHRLLTEHGKAKVLQLDLDRRVIEAAAGYLAAEASDVGSFIPAGRSPHCPTKRLPTRRPGKCILTMSAL